MAHLFADEAEERPNSLLTGTLYLDFGKQWLTHNVLQQAPRNFLFAWPKIGPAYAIFLLFLSSLKKLIMDLIEHILFLLVAVYFILAERGIIKLPSQKMQLEFDDRMKIKRKKYLWLTLAYAVLGFSIYLIAKDLYFRGT